MRTRWSDIAHCCWLYRLYDESNNLLYVGVSSSPDTRLSKHRREKRWWPEVAQVTMLRYDTRAAAMFYERAAITEESPIHNVVRPSVPGVCT